MCEFHSPDAPPPTFTQLDPTRPPTNPDSNLIKVSWRILYQQATRFMRDWLQFASQFIENWEANHPWWFGPSTGCYGGAVVRQTLLLWQVLIKNHSRNLEALTLCYCAGMVTLDAEAKAKIFGMIFSQTEQKTQLCWGRCLCRISLCRPSAARSSKL